jgi:hypothetical protein
MDGRDPRTAIAVVLLASALAAPVGAQSGISTTPAAPQWELRIDGTAADANAAHVGVGLNVRGGHYVRSGFALATGVVEVGDEWRPSHRLDLTARFLLDPFGDDPRGLYGGAGVTVRADDRADPAARLLLVIGLEGNPDRRWVRSVEVALGGGVRVGLVLRPKRRGSR